MILTNSYKFKLLPIPNQESWLNDYFYRFQMCVNFAAKKILVVEAAQKEVFELIKEGIKGKCSYCNQYYKLCKEHKPEGKNTRDRNKICKVCNQKSLLNRRKKVGKELVCQKCWNKEFSIRKILYAIKGKRKRSIYGDVRDVARLPGTEYALAFKRAADTLKSYKRQQSKIKSSIKYKERQLVEWKEVLENKQITLKELKELAERYKKSDKILHFLEDLKEKIKKGAKISARFILPRQPKQKVDRYKHIIYKDSLSRGKSELRIKRIIEALKKTVEKLNKRLGESKINFGGTIVDLQNTAVKNINEKDIELSVDGKIEKLAIAAGNVKSGKSREWLLGILKKIKNAEPRYPLLLKHGDNFYLSYPVRQEVQEPSISKNTKVMGIDRGVNQIAVTVILDKSNGTPNNINFYSGRDLMQLKEKYQLIRKKFTGTKSVNKRRAKFGTKVSRISDYLLHNISRKIVTQAVNLKPIAISMEDLKITQGEKRVKIGSALKERRINFKLSNFVYGKLQKLIEYKALQAGIPVRYVNARYTSQQCYICHQVGKRTKGFFECINPECKHKMNADLNASINIANLLYKQL